MSGVYFITAPQQGMVKIGQSIAPEKRYRELCVGSPVPLFLRAVLPVGDRRRDRERLERQFHERHFAARHHDEWFMITGDLLADMAAINGGSFDMDILPPVTKRTWRCGPSLDAIEANACQTDAAA